MDWIEALILGIIQGLTEYLPVSSSGHLAIGQALFGMQDGEENLMFTVAVHVATILSTLVVLWKEISWIVKGVFKFDLNAETKYFLNIVVSMIPVGIVGLFFKDQVEEIFGSGLLIVGCCLLLTAALLIFSYVGIDIVGIACQNHQQHSGHIGTGYDIHSECLKSVDHCWLLASKSFFFSSFVRLS